MVVLLMDVQVIAVDTVADDRRCQLPAEDGDFALTMRRTNSKVIDGETAGLVRAYTQSRTTVDAVLEYWRAKPCDPKDTLEAA
jgi:hypothetical protein